jgi:HEAT repeat protein
MRAEVLRRAPVLLLLLIAAAFPQDRRSADRLVRYKREWRKLDQKSGFGTQRKQYVRLAEDIAKLGTPEALQFLVPKTRELRHTSFHGELIRLLAKYGVDNEEVEFLMREHMSRDSPYRNTARQYLYKWALRKREAAWMLDLFSMGDIEDRFMAVQGLGELNDPATLDSAESLARDPEWKPSEPLINCGTIATAVNDAEGQRAARLLLLLQRDARFRPKDQLALRAATRLWRQSDLRAYVELTDLASPDVATRVEAASFMGRAGIESARSPLVRLAFNRHEDAQVRAAAGRALGGLKIAQGALVTRLRKLLEDADPDVRVAAIEGLGGLRIHQAAKALEELLEGPYHEHAVQALMKLSSLSVDTDWHAWIKNPLFRLPDGT